MATTLTFVIWLVYTILFYQEYKRQRLPQIVIHQAKGYDLDSTYMVTNLSKEPIHIRAVMMYLELPEQSHVQNIYDYEHISPTPEAQDEDIRSLLKQGPLSPGGFLVLGSLRKLLKTAARELNVEAGSSKEPVESILAQLERFEVRIVALHGAYKNPVGAYRNFDVHLNEQVHVRSTMETTQQLVSRSGQRQVRTWLED